VLECRQPDKNFYNFKRIQIVVIQEKVAMSTTTQSGIAHTTRDIAKNHDEEAEESVIDVLVIVNK
jgi:hypothetical protein